MSEFPSNTWKKTILCSKCGKERPWFLFHTPEQVCDMCERKRRNLNNRRSRHARRDDVRAAGRARYHATSVPLRRCRNSYYQVRVRTPQNIPFWATMSSVLPIYEYAHELNLKDPGFSHKICHKYPLRGKKVCGLHTLKNLRIVRSPIARNNSA